MSNENEKIIRRFVDEVINSGDYSAMRELLHPNYVYRSPDQELCGQEALESLLRAYRTGLPNINVSIDDLVSSGNKVAISITLSGTHTGELMGMPATGNSLEVHGMVLSRIEDQKLIEEWEILDMLGMVQQLGGQ